MSYLSLSNTVLSFDRPGIISIKNLKSIFSLKLFEHQYLCYHPNYRTAIFTVCSVFIQGKHVSVRSFSFDLYHLIYIIYSPYYIHVL